MIRQMHFIDVIRFLEIVDLFICPKPNVPINELSKLLRNILFYTQSKYENDFLHLNLVPPLVLLSYIFGFFYIMYSIYTDCKYVLHVTFVTLVKQDPCIWEISFRQKS